MKCNKHGKSYFNSTPSINPLSFPNSPQAATICRWVCSFSTCFSILHKCVNI